MRAPNRRMPPLLRDMTILQLTRCIFVLLLFHLQGEFDFVGLLRLCHPWFFLPGDKDMVAHYSAADGWRDNASWVPKLVDAVCNPTA